LLVSFYGAQNFAIRLIHSFEKQKKPGLTPA